MTVQLHQEKSYGFYFLVGNLAVWLQFDYWNGPSDGRVDSQSGGKMARCVWRSSHGPMCLVCDQHYDTINSQQPQPQEMMSKKDEMHDWCCIGHVEWRVFRCHPMTFYLSASERSALRAAWLQ